MSLDYSFFKTITLLWNSICDYSVMKFIILCSIIFFIILHINSRNKKLAIVLSIINIILIYIIFYFYHNSLFSIQILNNFMHNIYFYFINSVLYLIIFSITYYKIKNKLVSNIIYCLILILLLFSLFMTYYVHNIPLITIGNIYPMIVIGNYLYFIYYSYIIIKTIVTLIKK